ncbi:MAG: GNAT family N-acetyltransferase [Phycisphaerae bacterium]
MFRIRCLYSMSLPLARDRLVQVQDIFRESFPPWADYADKIPDLLENPFRRGYRAFLLISETTGARVTGFALVLHYPEVNACHLDYVAIRDDVRGRGLGSALYEAVRELAKRLKARGLYMDVESDDPQYVKDPRKLQENRNRLRFYERLGVRPIANTAYEDLPERPEEVTHLLFDPLGRKTPLRRKEAREVMQVILTERYRHEVPQHETDRVIESITDDPVQFRPPRYTRPRPSPKPVSGRRLEKAFVVAWSGKHQIHHVIHRGYEERPARVDTLRKALDRTGLFTPLTVRRFGLAPVHDVHDRAFVRFLRDTCGKVRGRIPFYADTFPAQRPRRKPKAALVQAGYYCTDSFTPLNAAAYQAARYAADVALTAADGLLQGRPVAYALCRPPGHHAGVDTCGGFCYLNNAAIAAHYLSGHGTVAVLDTDYHHGNGTQEIFYRRRDVRTVSIHGHPDFEYPYFSGFADERGEGEGLGYNHNIPLPAGTDDDRYLPALRRAIRPIREERPDFVVLCVGFDVLSGDPTATFDLTPLILGEIGKAIAALHRPILVVQEGGYRLRNLRRGAISLFNGLAEGLRPITPAG